MRLRTRHIVNQANSCKGVWLWHGAGCGLDRIPYVVDGVQYVLYQGVAVTL